MPLLGVCAACVARIRGIARVATIGGEPVGSLSVGIPKARFDEAMQRRAMDLLERTSGLLETT